MIEIQPNGRFAALLVQRAEVKSMSLRDLAVATECSYEHMRKLVKGLAYPSKPLLKSLCDLLEMDREHADKCITADKIQHKFGKIPALLAGKNPEMDAMEKNWTYLTMEQKQVLNTMAMTFAQQNRRLGDN
jgi:hypothetical protein